MASRTSLVRVGAALLGVSTALMIGVLPASAGTSDQNPTAPVTGTNGREVRGATITMDLSTAEAAIEQQPTVETQGVLVTLNLAQNGTPLTGAGASVQTYCIDLTTSLVKNAPVTEGEWSTFAGRDGSTFSAGTNSQKINWILHNSYPAISNLGKLSTSASLPDTISQQDAISATQAAIWHFSDAADLDTSANLKDQPDANLVALYNYLIGSANTGEPEASIDITPIHTGGAAGKLIGPFTISSTNVIDLKLDTTKLPSGVTVTDANGKQLTGSLSNGSTFYLDVPTAATATTGSAIVSGSAEAGRIFVADTESQQLIAAGSTTVQSLVSATWTLQATGSGTAPSAPAAPGGTTTKTAQPGLAYTGVSATGPIVLGILLVAAGGLFLLVQRRLKRAA